MNSKYTKIPVNVLVIVLIVLLISGIVPMQVQATVQFSAETIFEAEDGVIATPMQIYANRPDASGNYVMVPATNLKAEGPFNATATPEAKYPIQISKSDMYQVWARIYAPHGGADSLFLAFDNAGSYATISMPSVSADWQWVKLNSISLAQGIHDLKIKYREPGMGIDRFVLTNNASYIPSGLGINPEASSESNYPNPYTLPEITPPTGHPRLYVRSSDLPQIRENLTKGELQAVWANIINSSKQNVTGNLNPPTGSVVSNYDDNTRKVIEANALLYLINGDVAAGQKAVSVMYNFFNTAVIPLVDDSTRRMGQLITTGAIVYDWCYNLMTDEQRLSFRMNMERIASNMEIGYPPTKQGAVVGHGTEAQLLRDILAFGVAAYDENKNIYEIAAGRFFQQYVDARNYMYASGWQNQGDSYGMYRYQWDMFATWLFDRMGKGNVFNPEQAKLPYQNIYTRRPDGQLLRNGDTFATNAFGQGVYWTGDVMAQLLTSSYYKDPVLRNEFLKAYQYGTSNYTIDDIWMVLFDDPNLSTGSEASLPLSKYFGDPMGIMVARTGWDGGYHTTTAVAEMNIGGMYFANHQHLDAGSFQLYYKGGLAIDSGVYQGQGGGYASSHDLNYNKRTIASNSMLVYDPNESFSFYGRDLANDGGQRFPGNLAEPSTLDDLLNPANGYRTATVLNHTYGPDANTPDFTYIQGDLTKAYSSKVGDYKRSMVFLNMKNNEHPAAMLVYDKLTATNPDFKKTWLLHSQAEPEINGNTVTLRRNDSAYNGKLVNTTLLPSSDVSITKVGGSGNEYSVNGINYPNPPSTPINSDESGVWRVEVSPNVATATNQFLNVMQVMDDVGGPAPMAVEQVNGDKLVGAKISDRVVLFGQESQPVSTSATFSVGGNESNLYYLVTDLAPGYWTVTKAGETATTQYAVAQHKGELYFTGSAGVYTITRYEVRSLPEPPSVPNIPLPTAASSIVMKLDGAQLTNDEQAQIVGGTVMVPVEKVFGALGARVQGNVNTGTWVAKKLETKVELTAGSNLITVNGVATMMNAAALLVHGKLYIPISSLPVTTWGKATWDASYQIVNITSIPPTANYGLIGITVSDGVYSGENTIDGDLTTKWSAAGDNVWITYDLGSVKPVNRIGIAWYKGDERNAIYDIQVSENGVDWSTVYSGQSSGTSLALENNGFTTIKARYVRIVGHGYMSKYGWIGNNAISEVKLYSGQLDIAAVSTISEALGNEGNTTLDGNLATYWAAEGDNQWIQYDLGSVQTVNGVGTAWFKGDVRQEVYDLLVSADGSAWTTVFSGRNSGTTLQIENKFFPDVQARYVRIVGHGNTISGWNSLAETVIYGLSSVTGTSALSAGMVSFTDSAGTAVDSLVPGSTVFTNVYVTNGGNHAADVMLAVSLIQNDTQQDLAYSKAILQPGETKILHAAIDLPAETNASYLKVFLWDGLQHPVRHTSIFPEQDTSLKSISVGGIPLAGFDPNILTYTVDPTTISASGVPFVSGETNSPLANVSFVQSIDAEGIATITVTDSAGVTTKVYQIKFHVISHDDTLKDLKVNGTGLAGFSSSITNYTFTQGTSQLPNITATANHSNATVLISQPTSVPGVSTITVTAEDGVTTQQYIVHVQLQLGTVASLKDLKINNTSIAGFSSGITSYSAGLTANDLASYPITTITALATDPNATVLITQPTGVPGTATVKVTAEDGVTVSMYTINLTYIKGTDATLKSLKAGSTGIPGFSSSTMAYTYSYLPNGHPVIASVPQISAAATDPLATVVVTQAKSLPGTAVVLVTAEDGVTVKLYNVTFNSVNVGGTSVITAFNNAYVSSTSPNTNYHSSAASPYLLTLANKYITYLKFDISGVIGNVSTATLEFRAQTWAAGPVTLSVYGSADNSWNESGVTWNSKPASGTLLGSVSIDTAWKENSVDIASYLSSIISANQLNPATMDPYVTFVIQSSSTSVTTQAASKDRDYYPPYLKIKTN